MLLFLQLCLIIFIVVKLDYMNHNNNIRIHKINRVNDDLNKTLKNYENTIINDSYFYKYMILKKNLNYIISTKHYNFEGTFLGCNGDNLFITNNVYIFEINKNDINKILKVE